MVLSVIVRALSEEADKAIEEPASRAISVDHGTKEAITIVIRQNCSIICFHEIRRCSRSWQHRLIRPRHRSQLTRWMPDDFTGKNTRNGGNVISNCWIEMRYRRTAEIRRRTARDTHNTNKYTSSMKSNNFYNVSYKPFSTVILFT